MGDLSGTFSFYAKLVYALSYMWTFFYFIIFIFFKKDLFEVVVPLGIINS